MARVKKAPALGLGQSITAALMDQDPHMKFGDTGLLSSATGYISTGNMALDCLLSGGDTSPEAKTIPMARITTIAGEEHTGKTTLLAQIMAQCQQMGGVAGITETEEAIAPYYWEALGVDIPELMPAEVTDFEEVFGHNTVLINYLTQKYPDTPAILGWDSINSAFDKSTFDVLQQVTSIEDYSKIEISKNAYGKRSLDLGPKFRGLIHSLSKSKIAFVATNHLSHLMNVTMYTPLADKWNEPGGKSFKFYASVRLWLMPGAAIKDGDVTVGRIIKAHMMKNKITGKTGMKIDIPLIHGRGFCNDYTTWYYGRLLKVITSAGAWYSYNDVKWQGRFPGFLEKMVPHESYAQLQQDVKARLPEVIK